MKRLFFALLFASVLGACCAWAQGGTSPAPCGGEAATETQQCPAGWPYTNFSAQNLMDGTVTEQQYFGNHPTLYGSFGSNESTSSSAAQAHYQQGITLGQQITPLCTDGTTNYTNNTCANGSGAPAIVFLFIGFSNLDIEIGGGAYDIWEFFNPPSPQPGQPCATFCPNPDSAGDQRPWNQPASDHNNQENSLLRLAYPSNGTHTLGSHVVLFNGALGDQTFAKWDPAGFYSNPANTCSYNNAYDPECNYDRIAGALATNGFAPVQVQAVFVKSAEAFPQYCLNTTLGCTTPPGQTADAYTAETFMGDIMRFLKMGYPGNNYPAPYAHLKQVFITSRTYGGYGPMATGIHGCLNPEPFAYELGFSVQRLVVAQINQTANLPSPDPNSGNVDYSHAPWFDWGPYLWAGGETPRSDNLVWCGGQQDTTCNGNYDVREGNLQNEGQLWGDYTHPNYNGLNKVANLLFQWLTNNLNSAQSFMSGWVTPWVTD